jgi:hypothetical protein
MESNARKTSPARLRQLIVASGALLLACLLLFMLIVRRAAADTATAGFVGAPSQMTMTPWASSKGVAIEASDCGSADSCVATGYYENSANNYSPLVVPIVDGTAATGSEVSLPAGANPAGQRTNLADVSCWDAGSCVAVGDYSDPSNPQALVVPISGGAPGAGTGISLPADANAAPNSDLTAVSCSGTGSCIAVGDYSDTGGNDQALIEPVTGGTAGTGIRVTAPAGSTAVSNVVASLNDISCWAAGDCVAVGSYNDAHHDPQPLVVPITDGVPGTAIAVSPPQDAAVSGSSTVPRAELAKVSCWGAGSCVAVGSYATAGNNLEGLVVPITGGVPGTAGAVPLPNNALTADSTQAASLNDVSCATGGQCFAVGDYVDSISPFDQQAFVDPITDGAAGQGEAVSLPSDAVDGTQQATLQTVRCPAADSCLAAGSYNNQQQELLVPISRGVPGDVIEPPAFANASFFTPSALSALSCTDSGSCLAFGTYANTSEVQMPTLYSLQAPISIDTSALPQTRLGSSYNAMLSAAGAWGSYSWSLSSGSLPTGLSLNTQTGEISGTPTAAGTSTFTVAVTGTGAPAQTATQQLRIIVAAPRRPYVSASRGSLQVLKNKVHLQVSCVGSACRGAVTLQAIEVVPFTVKVPFNVKIRIKVRVKVKVKAKATTPATGTVPQKPKPKYKYQYKFRTKLVRKYRTELQHQNRTDMIGRFSFAIAAGTIRNVAVTLDPTGRRLLAHAKHHRLASTLSLFTAGGNTISRAPTLFSKPFTQPLRPKRPKGAKRGA